MLRFFSPTILGYKMYSAKEFEKALEMVGFEDYQIGGHIFESSLSRIPFIIVEAEK